MQQDPHVFAITSPVITPYALIPPQFTCDGEGGNPELDIVNVPERAKGLALTLTDPDAPKGTWTHWLLWNIAPDTSVIDEASAPQGAIMGRNSAGTNAYVGPCPPSGTHRYIFRLFALDVLLNIPSSSTLDDLTQAMQGHVIAQSELIGRYTRP